MGRLNGKVAIITGAAQGMGEAHARGFAKEGAMVIMTDLNEKRGKEIAAEIGSNALFIKHDVTLAADWTRVLNEGEAKFGTVNVLVNNAGIIGRVSNTVDLTEDQYLAVIAVNQHSVFLGMHTVIPSMLKAGKGSIVNISSAAGIAAIVGSPNLAYVGSKFAVRGMCKQVAVEFGAKNIRCNSVHPGYIKTPMMVAATDADGGGAADVTPLKRLAEPSEVTNLVLFLAQMNLLLSPAPSM